MSTWLRWGGRFEARKAQRAPPTFLGATHTFRMKRHLRPFRNKPRHSPTRGFSNFLDRQARTANYADCAVHARSRHGLGLSVLPALGGGLYLVAAVAAMAPSSERASPGGRSRALSSVFSSAPSLASGAAPSERQQAAAWLFETGLGSAARGRSCRPLHSPDCPKSMSQWSVGAEAVGGLTSMRCATPVVEFLGQTNREKPVGVRTAKPYADPRGARPSWANAGKARRGQ